jgi:hypothetical protein
MKKGVLLVAIWATSLSFGQNTFPASGNVGIGTTNPADKLDVKGAAFIQSTNNNYNENLRLFPSTNNDYSSIALGAVAGNSGTGIGQWTFVRYPSINNYMFSIRYNSSNYFNIINNGNIGIETTNPRANLDMAKDISNSQLGTVFGRLPEGDEAGLGTYLGVKGYTTQGADEYNIKSFSIVHDFYGQTNSSINFYRGGSILGGFIPFNTSDNTEKMRIGTNGNLGIGTTSPDEKLTVKGKIHAQEVRVDMLGALVPDYVFSKDYKLKSLQEVEEYIERNNHLPEIPSAQEIKKNGLILAEMNMGLLKKVEELTLYMI